MGQVLNRVVRLTFHGFELEAGLWHAELIIEQVVPETSKPVVTPGVDTEVTCAVWDDEPEGEELAPEFATKYRAIAVAISSPIGLTSSTPSMTAAG